MRVRHFHGYGIRALRPPVSVKLENVLDFSFWFVWVEVEGLGERVVGQPRGLRSGCRFEVGNRDKQGSDGDDDDGGTWTRPDKKR